MRTFLLALILLSLLACTMEPDTIRIGSNRWLGQAPLYLADELQWMKRAGLRLSQCPSAGGVLRAFRNNRQMLRDGRLPGSIEHLNRYMGENRPPSRPARAPELLASRRGHRC